MSNLSKHFLFHNMYIQNGATLFVYGTHGGLGLAYDADSWFHMENLIAINSNLACRYDDIWHLICF